MFEASDDYPPATLYALELLFNLLIDATSPNHLNINVIDFARYEAIATAAQVTSYFRAVAKVLEVSLPWHLAHVVIKE